MDLKRCCLNVALFNLLASAMPAACLGRSHRFNQVRLVTSAPLYDVNGVRPAAIARICQAARALGLHSDVNGVHQSRARVFAGFAVTTCKPDASVFS
jgi:hypothetical protein